MPIYPFGSDTVRLTKSPKEGNKPRFSNGKDTVDIIAWDLKNSKHKRQYTAYNKVFNDENILVLQTFNPMALQLESDDSATWEGRAYSVQEIHPIEVALGINKRIFEIILR